MKVTIENLGAIKQAEFSLGKLTVICGKNNSGKTYATYALFAFLDSWRKLLRINISSNIIDNLLKGGITQIDLQQYVDDASSLLNHAAEAYTKELPKFFSANNAYFSKAKFRISLEEELSINDKFERIMKSEGNEIFSLSKPEDSSTLTVSVMTDEKELFPHFVVERVIVDAINEIVFAQAFPRPFIASAERTGAAIFRKELNFARNRLLNEISKPEKDIDPMDLLLNSKQDYALPVEKNVEFTRKLESISKRSSFITNEHPELLKSFSDMIGGEYSVTDNDELYFTPTGSKKVKLTMDESSSSVRSLLDIGFYLKHQAEKGDLLIIDEPELNLHPENQRRMARLFSRLINIGLNVFITTHSDYIIKELNTLIMFNRNMPHLQKLMHDEGYMQEELLLARDVKVYMAMKALKFVDGNKRRKSVQTLVTAKIDQGLGIATPSFDETINKMNQIQEIIMWGEE